MKTFHSDQTKRRNANKTRERTQSWRYVARDAVYLHGQNRNNRMGSILLWAKECRLTEMREHLIRQHVFHHASLQTTDQPTVDTLLYIHIFISAGHHSQREVQGMVQGSQQPTAVWVTPLDTFKNTWDRTRCFLRRPGDVSSCFSCNQIFFFFLEVGPSPSVFVATVTGF